MSRESEAVFISVSRVSVDLGTFSWVVGRMLQEIILFTELLNR